MRRIERKGIKFLLLFVIIGAIFGSIVGEIISTVSLFSGLTTYLNKRYFILDMVPLVLNLSVFELTFGLKLNPNFISIFGAITGIYVFKKI